MVWLIIGIILTVGLFVGLGFGEDEHYNVVWNLKSRQFLALLGLLVCLFGCVTKVPANSVGIIYSPFGGTKQETLSEGFHTKNLFDKVYKISTETQTTKVENLTTQTKDAQYVTSILDIKYTVNSSNAYLVFKQYRTLDRMSENLIVSTTQRVLEHVTTKHNVIDILGEKRSDIYSELDKSLKDEFSKYGVEYVSITIIDMDAGKKLEAAITAEAVAKKEVETAEQKLLKTQAEAKQEAIKAQAAQDAAKIKAETKIINAKATKEANELIAKSLNDNILQQQWIDKWEGKMPTYYGGDGGLMFNVGNSESKKEK